MADFAKAVEKTLKWEGGLVDDARDPGGITNYGISLKAHPDLGADGIRALTREKAIEIYRQNYWKYDALVSQEIADKVFDLAVNAGSQQAHKLLQRAINFVGGKRFQVEVDGVLGPQTIAAANSLNPERLVRELRARAAFFRAKLVFSKPKFMPFLLGWLRRDSA